VWKLPIGKNDFRLTPFEEWRKATRPHLLREGRAMLHPALLYGW